MNKWEKEVYTSLLDSEEEALKELGKQYQQALKDIGQKIKLFQSDIDMLDAAIEAVGIDDATKAVMLSQRRSKIYQKQFQEALQGQISGILDQMHGKNYSTIESYLKESYEDAYLGTMYDLAQQGIPIITPINQAAATHAILTDSKVVSGYYNRLGVDVDHLKTVISQEVSRGIASSLPYADIARNINNASRSGLYNAQRIARTEGHRIQNTASRDAANEAKAHGADLVKIWDSTLDGKTRESHRMVDGEVRELDEKFSNGLDRPGDPSGSAKEVINCRCAEIHKPRWDVDGGFIKMDNFTGELRSFESPEDYKQFKERYWSKENLEYMKYVQDLQAKYGTKNFEKLLGNMSDQEYKHFHKLETLSPFGKVDANGRFVNNTEKLFRYSEKIKPIKGYEDFVCHADPHNFYINMDGDIGKDTIKYKPSEFAQMIRNSSSYKGGDVRIISCQAGALPDGAAQQLANSLGVAVYAPTEIVNIDENGEMFISDNDILADMWYYASEEERKGFKQTGEWIRFEPGKG